MTKLESCGHFFGILQALATTVALGLGAWWFVEQRQIYPHAELSQSVDVARLQKGLIAVEVQVKFENAGKLLSHLTYAKVKVQNVSSQPYDYAALADKDGASYWEAKRPTQTPNPLQFNEGELRWPVLKQFDGPIDHLVEPGETDVLVFTFVLPCQTRPNDNSTRLRLIRVASDVLKPPDGGRSDFAWKARGFVDVSDACSERGRANENQIRCCGAFGRNTRRLYRQSIRQ